MSSTHDFFVAAVALGAQDAPPGATGPLWLVLAALFVVLFLVGSAQVAYRLKTDKPVPVIAVVIVLLLGVAAALALPRALRGGPVGSVPTAPSTPPPSGADPSPGPSPAPSPEGSRPGA